MRKVVCTVCLLVIVCLIAACQEARQKEVPLLKTAKQNYPVPPPAVADGITEAVRQWVAGQADENEVYNIPARGGKDVSGSLAGFHAVQQKGAETYTVCVDFQDGDDTYDVDFFVDRTAEGLIVRSVYLHKINGETIAG